MLLLSIATKEVNTDPDNTAIAAAIPPPPPPLAFVVVVVVCID
jgi:hypothetical protein